MATFDVKLNLAPEIIGRLQAGGLWRAAHDDGSGNRINGDEIMDAASVHVSLGIMAALAEGIKKAFRNRGKTKDDFAAEKEAARINTTCGAFESLLRDYLLAARKGAVDVEDLGDLIDALEHMEGCDRAGKLQPVGREELAAIGQSVAAYTAALTGETASTADADAFRFLREQLTRQKKWIEKRG
jgi:hypothetical protein